MSGIFELDDAGGASLDQEARLNPLDASQVEPGFMSGVGYGLGMGIMKGEARLGQLAGLAGSVAPMAADVVRGQSFDAPESLTRQYFNAMDEYVNRAADYWTPTAGDVGTAGQVLGGLAELLGPTVLSGGNPALGAALVGGTQAAGTGIDLARTGVDLPTAAAAGAAIGAAGAAGFAMPFLGNTLLSRVGSGVAFNLGLDISGKTAAKTILESQDYAKQAESFNPLDLTSLSVDVLAGALFGGVAHLSHIPQANHPSVADALATATNARHFQQDTAPGVPSDAASSAIHQRAMDIATEQLLRDEPVNVPAQIFDAEFLGQIPKQEEFESDVMPPAPTMALDESPVSETPAPTPGEVPELIEPEQADIQAPDESPAPVQAAMPDEIPAPVQAPAPDENLAPQAQIKTPEPSDAELQQPERVQAEPLEPAPIEMPESRSVDTITAAPAELPEPAPSEPPTPARPALQAPAPAKEAAPQIRPIPVAKKPKKVVALKGKRATAVTDRGQSIETQYMVIDANNLITSHNDNLKRNPKFPAELQPRYRSRVASEAQISQMASELNPELLAESPNASDGAPIIGRDLVVESGNARILALRRAYMGYEGVDYKNWLEKHAEQFGLNKYQVGRMVRPVLVRMGLGDYDRIEFARQANESSAAYRTMTEQAYADAAKLGDLSDLALNKNGGIDMARSEPFLRQFLGEGESSAEQGAMMTADGDLSQQGLQRLRNAIFAKAYDDPDLVATLTESTDTHIKNILNGMMRAAGSVARLKDLIAAGARHDMDFTGELAGAVRLFAKLKRDKMSVDDYLAQQAMIDDGPSPLARELLHGLADNAHSGKRIGEFISRMADAVDRLGDPNQGGLSGDAVETPSAVDIAGQAAAEIKGDYDIESLPELFKSVEVQSALQAVNEAPDMRVVLEDGREVSARAAIEDMQGEVAKVDEDNKALAAIVSCYLRTLPT